MIANREEALKHVLKNFPSLRQLEMRLNKINKRSGENDGAPKGTFVSKT